MGNELLIGFTPLFLAVERILTVIFVGLAKFCIGKKWRTQMPIGRHQDYSSQLHC